MVKKKINIYTVEVEDTHNFFVTPHAVLTHNMVLPIAFSVGLSVPFGAGAAGTVGSFFGPVTFVAGAALGCMAGLLVKLIYDDKVPTYTVDRYNIGTFERHVKQQHATSYVNTLSKPQITCSPTYVPAQPTTTITHTYPTKPAGEYSVLIDETEGSSLSLIIPDPSKSVIACGDTTPQEPLILISPAEPMPAFQCPGYSIVPQEKSYICILPPTTNVIPITIGCGGGIPEELSCKRTNVLFTKEKSPEEIISIINELEKKSKPGEATNGKTKQFEVNGTYDDAMEKFNELTPQNIKEFPSEDGKKIRVGTLADGRTINVRTNSTHGSPTLEIYNPSNERKLKFRYTYL